MDFDDFDAEDAAIFGGVVGFAEESIREENAPDPSEPDPWEFEEVETEPEPPISLRRRLEMMDPGMRETLLKIASKQRESRGVYNKSRRLKDALAREVETCRKEERETGRCSEESHGRMMKALYDLRNGGVEESDYIKFPELYFFDEIGIEKTPIEIDYAENGEEEEEKLTILPVNNLKYKGRIYIEALVKPGNVPRFFNIEYIKIRPHSKENREPKPAEEAVSGGDDEVDLPSTEEKRCDVPRLHPRSESLEVCDRQFRRVMKLGRNWRPSSIVKNKFIQNLDETITDLTTGLMWERGGSGRVDYSQARAYVTGLNHDEFATWNDWRLPTVDELATLLESERRNEGLYIDQAFNAKQSVCWSCDRRSGHDEAFCVYFDEEDLCVLPIPTENASYVRAVRRLPDALLENIDQGADGPPSEPGQRDFDQDPDLYFFRNLIEKGCTIKIDYGSDYEGFCHGHVIEPLRLFKLEKDILLSAYSQTEGKKRNYWTNCIMNVRCADESCAFPEKTGTGKTRYTGGYSLKTTTVGTFKIVALKEPPEDLVKIAIEECRNLPSVKSILFDRCEEQGIDTTGMFDTGEGIILIDLAKCIYNRKWVSAGMLPAASTWFTMLWTLYHEIGHAFQLLRDPSLSEKSLQDLEQEANIFAMKKVEEWVRRENSMPKFRDMGVAGVWMKQFINDNYGLCSLGSAIAIEAYERNLVADLEDIKDMVGPGSISESQYEELRELIDEGDVGVLLRARRYLNAQEFFSLGLHQKAAGRITE